MMLYKLLEKIKIALSRIFHPFTQVSVRVTEVTEKTKCFYYPKAQRKYYYLAHHAKKKRVRKKNLRGLERGAWE